MQVQISNLNQNGDPGSVLIHSGSLPQTRLDPLGKKMNPSLNQAEPSTKKRKTVWDKVDSIFLTIKEKLDQEGETDLWRIHLFGILT